MYHYMDEEQYQHAYEIACIGVTTSDWNYLGNKTLKKLHLPIAAQAFSHSGINLVYFYHLEMFKFSIP